MKNVCKKLFSLMLVAVLLVSIVPFQASAAANAKIKFVPAKAEDAWSVDWTGDEKPTDAEVLSALHPDYENPVFDHESDYQGTHYYVYNVTLKPVDDTPAVDETPTQKFFVKFKANGNDIGASFELAEDKQPANADLEAYLAKNHRTYKLDGFEGRKIWNGDVYYVYNVKLIADNNTEDSTTETTKPADKEDDKVTAGTYTVKLKFYTNNNSTAVRVVDITNSYALDNVIAWKEVQQYVKDNFVSSNSLGINIDGIYKYEGSAWANWVTSGYQATDMEIPAYGHRHDDITLMVMLTGYSGGKVSLKNSSNSNADSSNPKTGDNIFVAVTFMAVSATALTALYVYNKKRMVK